MARAARAEGRGIMRFSTVASAVALLFSAYSLWETSLKRSELKVFVPPVIRYASPLQNSNFEVFSIPVTITNEGARAGTVMSMDLAVSDPQNNVTKHFYSGDFGQWTRERGLNGDLRPFAPIPVPGRTSYSETVTFYARTDETVMQIVQAAGRFQFTITLDVAPSENFGPIERYWRHIPEPLGFEMELPELDHRAFTGGGGTIALHHKAWQSSTPSN
jgi:hypothetical protein